MESTSEDCFSCEEKQFQRLLASLPEEVQHELVQVCGGDCVEVLMKARRAQGEGKNHDMGEEEQEEEEDETEDETEDEMYKSLQKKSSSLTEGLPYARKLDSVQHVHLLYNPASGKRKGKQVMKRARRLLESAGKTVSVSKLQRRGHAEELCLTMDFSDVDVLCSIGGDGTFHECVNGIMKRVSSASDEAAKVVPPLAFIPAGTGNSFAKELNIGNVKLAVAHICRGLVSPIDVSRVSFGDSTMCYSFNSIHWGIASKVNVRAERMRWMGSSVRYLIAALMEMVHGKVGLARVIAKDQHGHVTAYNDRFALAIANNIITAGQGMKLAPKAKIDDGLIDLLLFDSASAKNLIKIFRKLYNGSHIDLPHVKYLQVQSFTIIPYTIVNAKAEAGPVNSTSTQPSENISEDSCPEIKEANDILDVDGELKGKAPFTCVVLPRALHVIL